MKKARIVKRRSYGTVDIRPWLEKEILKQLDEIEKEIQKIADKFEALRELREELRPFSDTLVAKGGIQIINYVLGE